MWVRPSKLRINRAPVRTMPPGFWVAEVPPAEVAAARAACGADPPSSSRGSRWISLPAGLPTVPVLPGVNAVVCAVEMFLVVPVIDLLVGVFVADTVDTVALLAVPAVPT